jgi:hypothetical protein
MAESGCPVSHPWLIGRGLEAELNAMKMRQPNYSFVVFLAVLIPLVAEVLCTLLAIACAVAAPVSARLAIAGRPVVPSRLAEPGAAPDRGGRLRRPRMRFTVRFALTAVAVIAFLWVRAMTTVRMIALIVAAYWL